MWLEEGEHPNYPEGVRDNTHFQEYGAEQIAKLVAESAYELKLQLLHSHLSKELKKNSPTKKQVTSNSALWLNLNKKN